jgi:hypothetical protein
MKLKTLSAMIKVALAVAALPVIADQGPSSSADSYLKAVAPGVEFTSILTVGDAADNGFRMVGLPDGLGVYDNEEDDTFTVLMNHELGNDKGVTRVHGGKGAFVSEWVIDKKTLTVVHGGDLIKQVFGWDAATQSSSLTPGVFNFGRFCSADLPRRSAFYNAKSHLGSKARIFLNGEEGGSTGYALAHVASGHDKGNSYVLGKFNRATNGSSSTDVGGWENLLANPHSGNKTVVVGNNDGGTGIMKYSVAVYVGSKTKTGSEVDKAGLTNGVTKFVNVTGFAKELNDNVNRTTGITSGTAFTLSDSTSTEFSRPEDGAWADARTFYFVTTDQIDKTDLTGGTQKGGTRLWKLNFNNDYTGGTIDVVIDSATLPGGVGADKPSMFDNITVNADGTLILQEDVGNNEHNGKIWQYAPQDGSLTLLAKFDSALFGDITNGTFSAGTHTRDEETSGVIDITKLLDRDDDKRYNLLVAQDHASAATLQELGAISNVATAAELVEGGQLLLLSRPEHESEHEHDDDRDHGEHEGDHREKHKNHK